jgi:asparagine synthase (glutamine-hydrolysing)
MAFLIDLSAYDMAEDLSQVFVSKPEIVVNMTGDDYEFISWGDPVCTGRFREKLQSFRSIEFIVNNIYSHYYYIFFDRKKHEFLIGNSLFGILPLYYCYCKGRLLLSDNALILGRYAGKEEISRRFILETMIFNYPLFNQSLIDGIFLLPSNSGIIADKGGIRIVKHTSVEDLFSHDPVPERGSIDRLTGIFLETVKRYLPDEQHFTALTGGFDSRALTAAGIYHEKPITCYCFGTPESDDLSIAETTAAKAGISFYPIELNEGYLRDKSLEAGMAFIKNSSGTATFTRAHYIFTAEKLSGMTKYIVTGNFGSEIFRAVHVPGVVISPALFGVFNASGPEEARETLRRSKALKYLNQQEYREEIAVLENDLGTLQCFHDKYRHLSRNKQFYIFVFEEIFRKYFGAELVNQADLVRNRTPFLDIDFLKAFLSTGFAGVYSGFFEDNPLKRYKGQILYANIIRKACPVLGTLPVDKGYRPDDLISLAGRIRILKGYISSRLKKRDSMYDPYGVKRAWGLNYGHYRSLSIDADLFNSKIAGSGEFIKLTDEMARLYSLIFIVNHLKNG